MTSEEGRKIISNGWKAAFITEAIEQGTKGLESLDPFFNIDPILNEDNQTTVETLPSQGDIDFFATRFVNDESDNEDHWEFEGIPLHNIFHIIKQQHGVNIFHKMPKTQKLILQNTFFFMPQSHKFCNNS